MKKSTLTKLNKLAKQENETAQLLKEIIACSKNYDNLLVDGYNLTPGEAGAWAHNDTYTEYDGTVINAIYIKVQTDYDKKLLAGLSTYNEKYMQTTFTHGNKECKILDIDKVVKNLFDHNQ